MTKLHRTVLGQHASVVGPRLLGSLLHGPNGSGRIVEVEAYGGAEDPASHAYRGVTPRTEPVFGPAGVLYVYLIYGMHHCANVVTGPDGDGQAVLIRAVEPVAITAAMRAGRPKAKRDRDLTNGPGKLCAALGIDRSHDGTDLAEPTSVIRLELQPAIEADQVVTSKRIGISAGVDTPWRWHLGGSDWVTV